MSGDYNINVNLNADVVGSDDVKALAKEIRDLLAGAEKGSKGIGNEAKKTAKGLKETKDEAEDLTSSIGQGLGTIKQLGAAAAAVWAAMKLGAIVSEVAAVVSEVTTLAARYETLGAVMDNVGANAGYSSGQMAVFEEQLKKTGISAIKSRDALTMMAGAQMDLTKSSELARVAQDAAVIGGINSSEAFQRMVQGIRSGQTETLRTIGINVNFQKSYNDLAKSLGKSADALTNQEKTLARQNAVMDEGAKLAGAYESSMETAGKQALSTERYIEDIKVAAGDTFLPAYTEAINMTTEALKALSQWLEDNKVELEMFAQSAKTLVQTMGDVTKSFSKLMGLSEDGSIAVLGMAESMKILSFYIALAHDEIAKMAGISAVAAGVLNGFNKEMIDWGKNTLNSATAMDKFLESVEAGQAKVAKTQKEVAKLSLAENALAFHTKEYTKELDKLAKMETGSAAEKEQKKVVELAQLYKDMAQYKRDAYKAGKFEEEFDGPVKPATGSGEDDSKALAEKAAAYREKMAKQELELTKAKHDSLIRIAKNALDIKQRDLDEGFKKQEISIEEYYKRRTAMLLEVSAKERKAKEDEIAAAIKTAAKPGEEKTKQAQIIRLQSDLNDMRAKEGSIIDENKAKSKAATQEFLADLQEIRIQLENVQGARSESSIDAEITAKFKNLRAQAEANIAISPDGPGLIDKLIDVEKAKAKFAALQKVYNDTLDSMAVKEQQIFNQEQAGTIGPSQAYTELNKVHLETSAILDTLLPQMAAYASAIGDESIKNAVENMKLGVVGIKDTVTGIGAAIDSGVTDDVKSLFDDLTDSSKEAGQSVEDFGRNVLRTFMDIINKQLAMQLMTSLFGGGEGGGSSAGFWSSLASSFMKKKDGGAIHGPGTSTSDSIPALLSDGEYVIRASAAKKLGIGYLDYINGIASRPKFSKFSEGGPAVSSVSPTTSEQQAGGGGGDVKVVNLFDPSMLDEVLKTRRGEKAILNVIEANPQFVKALIR